MTYAESVERALAATRALQPSTPMRPRVRCVELRLPFEPLERLLSGSCAGATARTLGVDLRQIYRWRRQGVTWALADELAVRVGLHPAVVWGRDWWDLDE